MSTRLRNFIDPAGAGFIYWKWEVVSLWIYTRPACLTSNDIEIYSGLKRLAKKLRILMVCCWSIKLERIEREVGQILFTGKCTLIIRSFKDRSMKKNIVWERWQFNALSACISNRSETFRASMADKIDIFQLQIIYSLWVGIIVFNLTVGAKVFYWAVPQHYRTSNRSKLLN